MAIIKNAVKAMESLLSEEQVRRAHYAAQKEILALRQLELKNKCELNKNSVSILLSKISGGHGRRDNITP